MPGPRGVGPSLRGETFETVLWAAQAGAGWALERIYEDLAPSVAGYLRLRGADDPQGLTNEVFIGVLRGIAAFVGDEDDLRSWIFTIAHRRVIDDRRRRSVRPETAPFDPDRDDREAGDVEAEALVGIEDAWVRDVLTVLSDDQRDVILLRVLADLSVQRTAEILGKRPGAVKQLQRRGLLRLRAELDDRGVTQEAALAIAGVT